MNRDGYRDWLVLDGRISRTIIAVSGRDGSTLRQVKRPTKDWFFVNLAFAGDVDGDGIPDYGVKRILQTFPWGPDIIEVRSGKDDRILWGKSRPSFKGFGRLLLGDIDLNGDSRPDFVFANPRNVESFDHTGKPIHTLLRSVTAIGKVGDLDRDGRDDLVVACTDASGRGTVCVISGKDGLKELARGVGVAVGDRFGFGCVGGCGDVDGDGVLDFYGSNDGRVRPGYVRVFSGRTGKPIWTFSEPKGRLFGVAVAVGDLDLDGAPDMLVGSSLEPPGRPNAGGTVFWFSLRDGREVARIYPPGLPQYASFFGSYDIAIGSPHPGNPFPTFLVPEYQYQPSGRLVLHRAAPSGVLVHGRACAGKLDARPRAGFVTDGPNAVRFHLSDAPPGAAAMAFFGLSRTRYGGGSLPMRLDALGWPGCSLYTSIEVAVPISVGRTGRSTGYGAIRIPAPLKPGGVRLYAQWAVFRSGMAPGGMSYALSWKQ